MKRSVLAGVLVAALAGAPAWAQTVKIGIINTFSGPNSNMAEYMDKGMKLYVKSHASSLPAGVKLEFVVRDDGGPRPDNAKRLAQELIVREHVQLLTGLQYTPNAAAIAPLTAEAKVPLVIMNAGGSALTRMSPYVTRVSFTLWQVAYPLGQWAGKKYKKAYSLVSDFVPGHDAEAAFEKGFKEGGGQLSGKLRVPLDTQDYAPFLQRVKDAKPEALFAFVPAGRTATALLKAFSDLGLDKAGIKFLGTGDLTPEDELPAMGTSALGMITSFHYSAQAARPANKEFVALWKKEYGEQSEPTFTAVAGWDAMDAIFHAIREQNGKIDPDRTMALLKTWSNRNSPRGQVSIDPETRDVVQNVYLREVRKVNGRLANVELETIGTAVKDPWKQLVKP